MSCILKDVAPARVFAGTLAVLTLVLATAAQAGPRLELADLGGTPGAGTLQNTPAGEPVSSAPNMASDARGNLYGTTVAGGSSGLGTVYRLAPDGTLTILHSFSGGADGAAPQGGLTADAAGNLYGTTSAGGRAGCADNKGCGTVFKISAAGAETLVYAFEGGRDGSTPVGNLLLGRAGRLYGITMAGGVTGHGTVFEFSPAGGEKILHSFTASEGSHPLGVLNADAKGNLYGSTAGVHDALFRLAPDGTLTILFQFA